MEPSVSVPDPDNVTSVCPKTDRSLPAFAVGATLAVCGGGESGGVVVSEPPPPPQAVIVVASKNERVKCKASLDCLDDLILGSREDC